MTAPGTDAFAQARTYLMCPPRYFGVSYAINPWMHPDRPADTALCMLDSSAVAYYPAAFDDAGRAALASHFTELIEAKDEDAEVLGLNAISDGRHVVLPTQARGLAGQIAAGGSNPCRWTYPSSARRAAGRSAARSS
jgi:N-dimethylarginine dimethylaminohydrolase